MDLALKNKVVIVTGSAGEKGSIGQTIVQALAAEGTIPVMIDISERGYEYESALKNSGINASFYKTNLLDYQEIEATVQKIGKKYGRIDALINNLGVNDGVGLEQSIEAFVKSLQLNLVHFFAMTKFCLPFLKASKGNILNIGSKVALTGQGSTSGYAAAKGGVLGLTREWAVDLLPYGIRSNAILIAESWTPSYKTWIDSIPNGAAKRQSIIKKIPLEQRMTTPQEIADVSLFTISPKSSHTTGQFIFVDGGYVHLDRALLVQ